MRYKRLFDLKTKTAIITGGASGLGREMVNVLLEFGANVVVVDNDIDKIENCLNSISQEYQNKILTIKADVSSEKEVIEMRNKAIEHFGKVDILINNAAINHRIGVEDQTLEDWKRILNINLNSVFIVSKYVGEHMKKNQEGTIINMASISSYIANREPQAAYNASKSAIENFTKTLASEWMDYNIRVNAVAPGYMNTKMVAPLFEKDGDMHHLYNLIPMKRLGEPHEIGGVVALLSSDASSFITGATITVDGGYTIW